jgi:transketolase C-terminal domain/subunit
MVKRLGLQDVYGESASNDELLELYGLSATRVADQVQAFVEVHAPAGRASQAG